MYCMYCKKKLYTSTVYKSSQPYNFLCVTSFATFLMDSNLASNIAFLIPISKLCKKIYLGHVSTFCKLLSQMRTLDFLKKVKIIVALFNDDVTVSSPT
jgi:hypothetical protein